jgi:hypothetical protein
MKSRAVRKAVGLDKDGDDLVSNFPAEEVGKTLLKIVDDLSSKRIKVKDIYDEEARADYLKTVRRGDLPAASRKLNQPVALSDLEPGKQPRKAAPRPRPAPPAPRLPQRTTLIPNSCRLNPQPPRINAIYNELLTLNVDTYPNATAVLLRVFVELSLDHYIAQNALTIKSGAKLFERLKLVSAHLFSAKKIPDQLRKAIDRIAGTQKTVIAASTVTFNQYVHNSYVHPKPSELYAAWDELQPFMEQIWV